MGKSKKFQKETDGKFERRLEPRKTKHLPYGAKHNGPSRNNNTYGGHNVFEYIHNAGEFSTKVVDKSWAREENKRIIKSELQDINNISLEEEYIEYQEEWNEFDEEYSWHDNDISDEDYEKYKHIIIN